MTGLRGKSKDSDEYKNSESRFTMKNNQIELCNELAFWFFVAGLGLMMIFIAINLGTQIFQPTIGYDQTWLDF